MALGFMKMFMPKDRVFYGLFEEMTGTLVEMGKAFGDALSIEDLDTRNAALRRLNDYEHACDSITHKIFIELGRNFITPFDREDIHSLASALDDIADFTWGSAKRILNYGLQSIDENMRGFAVIIQDSIGALHSGIHELRNMKNLTAITDCCVKVNSLENDADEILDKATIKLFSTKMEAIELIKLKDLYEEMELVTDKCEDAANVIETIIIKYS
jgi:hypothetical protein